MILYKSKGIPQSDYRQRNAFFLLERAGVLHLLFKKLPMVMKKFLFYIISFILLFDTSLF